MGGAPLRAVDPADLGTARLMAFSGLRGPKEPSEAMRLPPAKIRSGRNRLERTFGARSPRRLPIRLAAKTETLDTGPSWPPRPGEALGPGQADLLQRRFQGQGGSQIMRELGMARPPLANRKRSLSEKPGSQSLAGGGLLVLDKLGLSAPGGSRIDPKRFFRVARLASQYTPGQDPRPRGPFRPKREGDA